MRGSVPGENILSNTTAANMTQAGDQVTSGQNLALPPGGKPQSPESAIR